MSNIINSIIRIDLSDTLKHGVKGWLVSTTRVFQLKIKGEEFKTTRWPKSLRFASHVAVVDVKIAINATKPDV